MEQKPEFKKLPDHEAREKQRELLYSPMIVQCDSKFDDKKISKAVSEEMERRFMEYILLDQKLRRQADHVDYVVDNDMAYTWWECAKEFWAYITMMWRMTREVKPILDRLPVFVATSPTEASELRASFIFHRSLSNTSVNAPEEKTF